MITALAEIVLIAGLRVLRSYFQSPRIGEDKIVGYSQYFGYSINFDSIFILLLIIVPVFISVIMFYFLKKVK